MEITHKKRRSHIFAQGGDRIWSTIFLVPLNNLLYSRLSLDCSSLLTLGWRPCPFHLPPPMAALIDSIHPFSDRIVDSAEETLDR